MSDYVISSAQYIQGTTIADDGTSVPDGTNQAVRATINGEEMFVPLEPNNRHYAEIMRQVEAGELTIQEAD